MHDAAVEHLTRVDPTLARLIARVGACRFATRDEGTHFDTVVRSIVFQQLSGHAARTIYGRVLALAGGAPPTAAQLLAIRDETLRAAGLSRQKLAYMKDLARKVEAGEVPIEALHELSDADVIEVLTRVKGIGVWTAQMFLMFRLGRPDVFPDLDLGIRKAIRYAYGLRAMPSAARLRKLRALWSPYCTVACWYLWRSLEPEHGAVPVRRTAKKTARRKTARRKTAKRKTAKRKADKRPRAA